MPDHSGGNFLRQGFPMKSMPQEACIAWPMSQVSWCYKKKKKFADQNAQKRVCVRQMIALRLFQCVCKSQRRRCVEVKTSSSGLDKKKHQIAKKNRPKITANLPPGSVAQNSTLVALGDYEALRRAESA
jgi:hypothetical protein